MSFNLATLNDGPCAIVHKGQRFHFKDGLVATPIRELFSLESDMYGSLGQRAADHSFVLTGTPVGVWTQAQLDVLFPARYRTPVPGTLVTPRYDVDTVTAATDVITLIGATVPRTGCPVRISAFPGSTLPAGTDAATTYFWGAAGTLHATLAHALAPSDPIDITDTGTGDFAIIEQETTLIEQPATNRRLTAWNSAIIGMPDVIHSTVASMLGQVIIGCFRKNNAAWSDANSVFTETKVALTDTPPTRADMLTRDCSMVWGDAPFDSFKARDRIVLSPKLRTSPVSSDDVGNVGLKVDGLDVSATFAPRGLSGTQMLDVLEMQGGTAGRGVEAARGNLVITGTGIHNIVYNAAARELPQTFSTGPRAGELAAVGSADTAGARFYVGVAAPA